MKKTIRLTESDLVSMIKKIIQEDLEIVPFILKALGGDIKVTNQKTKKSYKYGLETEVLGFRKSVYVDSIDSETITVSVAGVSKTKNINKGKILNLLNSKFGSQEIPYTTKDGNVLYFVRKP